MPPTSSHSPRRKRVRRYFSASAATGSRWSAKLASISNTPSTSRTRRRGSSASSGGLNFSPDRADDDSGIEEEHSLRLSDDGSGFSQSESHKALSGARPPLIYASLPPTPISTSTTSPLPFSSSLSSFPSAEIHHEPPFSLWDYLREELLATDFDSHQELKWERVSNFLSMPLALEKVREAPYM